MILLDTNVVSEAIKRDPAPQVRAWLDAQAAETLYLSSVNVAELLFGVGALPDGERKRKLAAALDDILDLFAGRISVFDDQGRTELCGDRRSCARKRSRISFAGWLYGGHCRNTRLRHCVARWQRL